MKTKKKKRLSVSKIRLILTGAWPCHVPTFNQQERKEVSWQDDVSSQKRNFI